MCPIKTEIEDGAATRNIHDLIDREERGQLEDKKYGLSVSRTPDLIVITKEKQEVASPTKNTGF